MLPDMASEPVPEPLTNQKVNSQEETNSPASGRRGPELVGRGAPPIPAERELPRAPRQEEWKGAVRQKLEDLKETASRATDTASQMMQDAKEQAAAAVSQAKDRTADLCRDSRDKTAQALNRARARAIYIINEYPLHVIAGVATAAFVTGIVLRIWRSNRDA